MHKRNLPLLLLLSCLWQPPTGLAGEPGTLPPAVPLIEQPLMWLPGADTPAQAPPVDALLAEVNRNSDYMRQLMEKIVSEGCSRQLQEDTIKLVANMTRNIQIMTDVMIRMGYNIEEMSRAPKAMNSFPFMP